jgi:transcriptional regulator of acetoin/glycerol metabolism
LVKALSRTRHPKSEPQAAIVAPANLLSEKFSDPDLVDRVFEYIVQLIPEVAGHRAEVERQIRDEFASERVYVRRRSAAGANPLAAEVARLFDGRNATQVARELGISRATVYRLLKQPGKA